MQRRGRGREGDDDRMWGGSKPQPGVTLRSSLRMSTGPTRLCLRGT